MKYFDYLYKHKDFKCKMCDVKCNGVKVLLEHCKKEDLKRQSEKCKYICYVREWIEKVYVKIS